MLTAAQHPTPTSRRAMSSRTLRASTAETEGRRAALAAELARAETELAEQLDAGDDGEAIVRTQSRRDALANAIARQDAKLERLHAELLEAETAERRVTGLARLADYASEAAALLERTESLRAELRAVLEPRARQLAAYVAEQRSFRERFLALLWELAPGSNMDTADGTARAAAVLEELEQRGVDLRAIRSPTPGILVRTNIDQPLVLADQGPFGAAIDAAITAALRAQHQGV